MARRTYFTHFAADASRPLVESHPCGVTPWVLGSVSEQRQAKRFHVSGQVQGVGYRFFACHVAERLGIAGYVRNMRDGGVEVYAIGTEAQLRTLLAELRRGPRHAFVEEVGETAAELLPQFASHFSIDQDG